jgi:trigger factor
MNILREDVDALNAVLKIQISPEDYQANVKSALEKHRKTAKIPGFRPGMVPFGLIQKQYGKSVLAEEINKLSNDSLYKYITENKLDILGNPIPKEDSISIGNFDKPENFEFSFEIGFAPTFDLAIAGKKFEFPKVKIDDTLINKQIEDLQRRYGKLTSVEIAGEKDMILGKFEELTESGEVKADGISHSTTISLEFLDKKDASDLLNGKKVNDTFELNPNLVSKNDADKVAMLGLKEDLLSSIGDKFQFTISDIKQMELAELNDELFSKLFMDGEVTTVEQLKTRISDDLSRMFSEDSDRILTRNVYNFLLEDTKMEFPTEFLKRWIKISSEKPVTEEDIENEFDTYLKSLKWQLIQTKIFTENNLKLTNEEVIEHTKSLLISNYAQYGIPAPDDAELSESAIRLLKNKEQANGIYDRLAEQKLTTYFKSAVSLDTKEVSYDDFVEIASK